MSPSRALRSLLGLLGLRPRPTFQRCLDEALDRFPAAVCRAAVLERVLAAGAHPNSPIATPSHAGAARPYLQE